MQKLALSLKVIVLAFCFVGATSGYYPPAHAQRLPPPDSQIQMPSQLAVSPYDPEFASDILTMRGTLEKMETHMEAADTKHEALAGDVREMQANMKIYFWVIGGLLTGSIALPAYKDRKKTQA